MRGRNERAELVRLRRIDRRRELASTLATILELADFREGARSGRLPSRESSALQSRIDRAADAGSLHVAILERAGRLVAGHAAEKRDRQLEVFVAGRSAVQGEMVDPEAYVSALRDLAGADGINQVVIQNTAAGFFTTGGLPPAAGAAELVPWGVRAARSGWQLRQRLWSSEEFRCYRLRLADYVSPTEVAPLKRNSLADLMSYVDGSREGMSRQEFLATALARLEDGRLVYTASEGGRLIHSCWLIPHPGKLPVDPYHPVFQPSGAAVLSDAFTDPAERGRGLQSQGLHWRIHEARSLTGIDSLISYVIATNKSSRSNLEKAGFVHVDSLHTVRRFGAVWHRRASLSPDPMLSERRCQ